MARYGAFLELHSDQGTNFGSKVVLEVSTVWDTQDKDYTIPPVERLVHRTKLQDAGPVPEGGVPGDEAGVGRARATHPDELPGYATG